jgi:hypothetical protein
LPENFYLWVMLRLLSFNLRNSLLYTLLVCGIVQNVFSQCQTPFGVSFSQKTKTTVNFKWTDPNLSPQGWDVEIVPKNQSRTGIPYNSSIITDNKFSIEGLQPSSFYEIYLRTVCSDTQKSNWNGPFVFSTVLENPTQCQVDLDLKDNGTETFLIEVDESGILGQTVFLSSIDLICQHEWPADLRMTLTNPAGKSTILTNYYGTGSKNFGNIEDISCDENTKFTDQACFPIVTAKPPFNGSFIPFEELNNLHDNTQSKGIWKLVIHDRAAFHRGKLMFFNINLSKENCILPDYFIISEINNNSATVKWEADISCQSLKITIKIKNSINDPGLDYFLNCLDREFTIPNLLPDTEYDIFVQSVCGLSFSEKSCTESFKTKCKPITLSESFDQMPICTESCRFKCNTDGLWSNTAVDQQDWIVRNGKTDTENTGPEGDINDIGNYIYLESQPDQCGYGTGTILISDCIHIKSNEDNCDFSFYYHMSGQGIGSLTVEISTDGGTSWTELWSESGHQGNKWQRVLLSLKPYENMVANIRFIGINKNDIFGDIAVDQIEFYGSLLNADVPSYFRDFDNDGFGDPFENISVCNSNPPTGFVFNDDDCDDNNPNIYPGQTEILCNLIDENCNGFEDDKEVNSTLSYSGIHFHETCKGEKNGSINITALNGVPPYQYKWNTGQTTEDLEMIGHGIYYCTITDASGCSISTNYFEIIAEQSIQYVVTGTTRPSCSGKSDGHIFINHSGGEEPFSYHWSNGAITKNISLIPEGSYFVTITDKNGCRVESQEIKLHALSGFSVGATFLKHPTCYYRDDGEIRLGTVNGIGPFTYLWNDGNINQNLSQLPKGFYYCTVTDQIGCKSYFSTELTAPDSLVISLVNVEPVRCFSEKNGIIKTTTNGGVQPYLYFWNHSAFEDDIFDLEAGLYSLTVTDKNGCTASLLNVEVSQPAPLISMIDTIEPARCFLGKNGSISISSSGGSSPYFYLWNNPSIPETASVENLETGVYSVIIFDGNGCKYSIGSIYVPYENINLEVKGYPISKNVCFGDKNASVGADVIQGLKPFDFNWSNGIQRIVNQYSDTINSLPSGLYSVTVTDSEGCVGTSRNILIPFLPEMSYKILTTEGNTCAGDSSGLIEVEVTNANGSFFLYWNNGKEGKKIDNLPNGAYTGIVEDERGCNLELETILITSKSNLAITPVITNSEAGRNNGAICLVVNGANGSYDVLWDEQISVFTGNCANNLSPGIYMITVSDELLCEVQITVIVEEISDTDEFVFRSAIFYPNPTGDFLYSTLPLTNSHIQVMDDKGRLVLKYKHTEFENKIDVRYLASGLYFLQIQKGKKQISGKFLKM